MGTFDTKSFIEASYDEGSTEALLVPEGEYDFMMNSESPEKWFNSGTSVDDKTGESRNWSMFQPLLSCLDGGVRQLFGRDIVYVPYNGGFCDFDSGRLDMSKGKNIKINQLRDALGQNQAGWNLSRLSGAGPFKGLVRHETGKDGVTRHRVTKVAKK